MSEYSIDDIKLRINIVSKITDEIKLRGSYDRYRLEERIQLIKNDSDDVTSIHGILFNRHTPLELCKFIINILQSRYNIVLDRTIHKKYENPLRIFGYNYDNDINDVIHIIFSVINKHIPDMYFYSYMIILQPIQHVNITKYYMNIIEPVHLPLPLRELNEQTVTKNISKFLNDNIPDLNKDTYTYTDLCKVWKDEIIQSLSSNGIYKGIGEIIFDYVYSVEVKKIYSC